jgi:hypothetical protein
MAKGPVDDRFRQLTLVAGGRWVIVQQAIAEATSFHLRYEGDICGRDSVHPLTAGVRMT